MSIRGNEGTQAMDQGSVGTIMRGKVEAVLLDFIPVHNCLCAMRLWGSVAVRRDSCNVFVNSAYNLTKYRIDTQKKFHDVLLTLARKGSNNGVVRSDLNVSWKTSCIRSSFKWALHLTAQRTDEDSVSSCANNRLFTSITNFRHGSRRTVT